ncbi:hypothetical protein D039_0981, partial [Vibrio parahaemolyticus EKP-028]
MLGLILLLKC